LLTEEKKISYGEYGGGECSGKSNRQREGREATGTGTRAGIIVAGTEGGAANSADADERTRGSAAACCRPANGPTSRKRGEKWDTHRDAFGRPTRGRERHIHPARTGRDDFDSGGGRGANAVQFDRQH